MTARRTALLTAAATATLGAAGLLAPTAASAAPHSSTARPSPATAPAGAPSPAAAACDRTPWEAAVQGRPAGFGAGAPSGDYLWHTTHGFRLRVTHAEHDRRVYRGVIHSSAPMRMERVRLERGDSVRLAEDRRTIVFAFANHGAIDGIDFHTDCASSLTVSHLRVGGHRIARTHVYLGAKKQHPAAIPFTVHRRPTPST